ncbi:MAG: RNA methyltransferase, partial [Clostridium sp.]|nr:RNA methyltransferase [Clostridium sp.]
IEGLKLKIPMPGGAESLNASVAASVILFERVRQLENLYK